MAPRFHRLEGKRRVLGDEHGSTLISIRSMAALLNAQLRYTEAEQLVRESLPIHIRVLGENHWRTAEARSLLGAALAGLERYQHAETHLLDGRRLGDLALYPHRARPAGPEASAVHRSGRLVVERQTRPQQRGAEVRARKTRHRMAIELDRGHEAPLLWAPDASRVVDRRVGSA